MNFSSLKLLDNSVSSSSMKVYAAQKEMVEILGSWFFCDQIVQFTAQHVKKNPDPFLQESFEW